MPSVASNIAVFLGPSLPVDEAKEILSADYFPPVKRGNLASTVLNKYQIVAIIDGEFGQSLSVSVIEIRQLLDRGLEVWGASSMGALRAVECGQLGMQGVGWVFKQYKDALLDADDEVALFFNPITLKPLTVPKVNIRWMIVCALQEALIDLRESNVLNEVLSKMHYQKLTMDSYIKAVVDEGEGRAATLLLDWCDANKDRTDIKRLDAIELLQTLNEMEE